MTTPQVAVQATIEAVEDEAPGAGTNPSASANLISPPAGPGRATGPRPSAAAGRSRWRGHDVTATGSPRVRSATRSARAPSRCGSRSGSSRPGRRLKASQRRYAPDVAYLADERSPQPGAALVLDWATPGGGGWLLVREAGARNPGGVDGAPATGPLAVE